MIKIGAWATEKENGTKPARKIKQKEEPEGTKNMYNERLERLERNYYLRLWRSIGFSSHNVSYKIHNPAESLFWWKWKVFRKARHLIGFSLEASSCSCLRTYQAPSANSQPPLLLHYFILFIDICSCVQFLFIFGNWDLCACEPQIKRISRYFGTVFQPH